jgi:hypothetical protein
VGDWVRQVPLYQHLNTVIQRCREQHSLADLWGLIHQALNGRQETKVGHVVCLIEHSDLDGIERNGTLTHEIFKATRTGDDNVNTLSQLVDLGTLVHAAKNHHGPK